MSVRGEGLGAYDGVMNNNENNENNESRDDCDAVK